MAIRETPNPYPDAWQAFVRNTPDHSLTVVKEDGLYRHLRMKNAEGTIYWSWNIITTPGLLMTYGDIANGFMFSRTQDMLEFFSMSGQNQYSDGAPWIDVRYWAEKICDSQQRDATKEYSGETFLQHIKDHLSEHEDYGTEAQTYYENTIKLLEHIHKTSELDAHAQISNYHAGLITLAALWRPANVEDEDFDQIVDDLLENKHPEVPDWYEYGDQDVPKRSPKERTNEILDDAKWYSEYEERARDWLTQPSQEKIFGSDTWEWDLREYSFTFLLTCYAIHAAVQEWYKLKNQKALVAADQSTDQPT